MVNKIFIIFIPVSQSVHQIFNGVLRGHSLIRHSFSVLVLIKTRCIAKWKITKNGHSSIFLLLAKPKRKNYTFLYRQKEEEEETENSNYVKTSTNSRKVWYLNNNASRRKVPRLYSTTKKETGIPRGELVSGKVKDLARAFAKRLVPCHGGRSSTYRLGSRLRNRLKGLSPRTPAHVHRIRCTHH